MDHPNPICFLRLSPNRWIPSISSLSHLRLSLSTSQAALSWPLCLCQSLDYPRQSYLFSPFFFFLFFFMVTQLLSHQITTHSSDSLSFHISLLFFVALIIIGILDDSTSPSSIGVSKIHDSELIVDHPLEHILNGPSHHTLHHLHFTCNYGQYFTWADRVGKTYRHPVKGDNAELIAVCQRQSRLRPSSPPSVPPLKPSPPPTPSSIELLSTTSSLSGRTSSCGSMSPDESEERWTGSSLETHRWTEQAPSHSLPQLRPRTGKSWHSWGHRRTTTRRITPTQHFVTFWTFFYFLIFWPIGWLDLITMTYS